MAQWEHVLYRLAHEHSSTESSLPNALVAEGLWLLSTVALCVHVIEILVEKEAAG